MVNVLKLMCVISVLLVSSGCSLLPGNHLSIDHEQIINTDAEFNLSSQINVYKLTPELVYRLKKSNVKHTTQSNPKLDKEIADYKYHIGYGDVLNITIWGHPELTIPAGSFRSSAEAGNCVYADGTIFYPYIGRVMVLKLTVTQVRNIVARRLAKYIESPQVDVKVAAFRSKRVYVTGEVSSPSPQPITNIPLTLIDAINRAGGITADADWRQITLTRNGLSESLSLYGLIKKGNLRQNRLLQNNDIIHIPRNDDQKVFVMGEVNLPQTLKIDRVGMSLTEALSQVGGIDQLNANANGVFIIRNKRNILKHEGEKHDPIADIYQLDINNATALILGSEFYLQPYDVVYVTSAPISRWNRIVRQLLPTIQGFNQLTEGGERIRRALNIIN